MDLNSVLEIHHLAIGVVAIGAAVAVAVAVVCWWLLGLVWNWYYVNRFGYSSLLPPGDLGWPLIGNTLFLLKSIKFTGRDSFIHYLVTRYGETGIYKTHVFGRPSIIVTNAEIGKKVLSNEESFKFEHPIQIRRSDKALKSLEGAAHKRIRKLMLAPLTGHVALASYIRLIEDTVLTHLDEMASMSKPIEFLCEIKHASFEIIINILFGSSSDSLINRIENVFVDIFKGFAGIPLNLPGFSLHRSNKAQLELVEIIRGLIEERKMDCRRNLRPMTKCVLDSLLNSDKDGNNDQLDDEEILEILFALLLGGSDTSSHVLIMAIIYLQDHPEIQQKAKEEQEKIIKNRPSTQQGLTLQEIRELDFLPKVIQETLRKTSVVGSLFRVARSDVQINGYIIPKGWKVLVMRKGSYMDSKVYSNPTQFDPSRWDNNTGHKIGAFTPFGIGSRLCPASDLAKLHVSIVLHYFLLGYRLERLNPECPVEYVPFIKPTDNCLARIIKL